MKEIKKNMPLYTSSIWEELCRQSVPFIIKDEVYYPASRWWGKGNDGAMLEIDVIAESADKKKLLIGEVKWTDKRDIKGLSGELLRKIEKLPFGKNHKIIPALFVKLKPFSIPPGIMVFGPDEVVSG